MLNNLKPRRYRNSIIKKFERYDNQQNSNFNYYEKYGFLQISVYQNDTNKPVENAEVNVSILTISGLYQERGEVILLTSVKTDTRGYTPLIELPTLNRLSGRRDDRIGKMYILEVKADGYYNAYVFDIQIYPDVTTSYKINLRHVDKGDDARMQYEFIIEPNIPGHL